MTARTEIQRTVDEIKEKKRKNFDCETVKLLTILTLLTEQIYIDLSLTSSFLYTDDEGDIGPELSVSHGDVRNSSTGGSQPFRNLGM